MNPIDRVAVIGLGLITILSIGLKMFFQKCVQNLLGVCGSPFKKLGHWLNITI